MVKNFKSISTHLLHVPIYAGLQIVYSILSNFDEAIPY